MGDERQSDEISASAELTPTGFKAKLKSRAASAIDRFWGSKVDRKSVPIEADNAEIKAMSNARVKIIDALGDLGVERLKNDPEFAARAVDNFLPSLLRRQENKDAVLELALEDLRQNPSTDEQDASGAEALDDSFLDRFERYAEDASTEALRAKWGKVLAAEVRQPGTFSAKVLRVVDELEPSTALLFEQLCRHRLHNTIVKCLAGEMSFPNRANLVSAGLLVDPGLSGQIRTFTSVADNSGRDLWMCHCGIASVAVDKGLTIPGSKKGECPPIISNNSEPALPAYVLTDVGYAVSSILTDHQEATFAALVDRLATYIAPSEVREFRDTGSGHFQLIRVVKKAAGDSSIG